MNMGSAYHAGETKKYQVRDFRRLASLCGKFDNSLDGGLMVRHNSE